MSLLGKILKSFLKDRDNIKDPKSKKCFKRYADNGQLLETTLSYPPALKGIKNESPEDILNTQKETFIIPIVDLIGLTTEDAQNYFYTVLRNYASFVGLLPASRNDHHNAQGGLFYHGLETSYLALRFSESCLPYRAPDPKYRKRYEQRWRLAVAIAGLLHDVAKPATDLTVINFDGSKVWNPYVKTLNKWCLDNNIDYYFISYKSGRGKLHENTAIITQISSMLIPQETLQFLSLDDVFTDIVTELFAAFGSGSGNVIQRLVIQADCNSVKNDNEKQISNNNNQQYSIAVNSYFQVVLQSLIVSHKHGYTWGVNDPNGRIFYSSRESLFMLWQQSELNKDFFEIVDAEKEKLEGFPHNIHVLANILADKGVIAKTKDSIDESVPLYFYKLKGDFNVDELDLINEEIKQNHINDRRELTYFLQSKKIELQRFVEIISFGIALDGNIYEPYSPLFFLNNETLQFEFLQKSVNTNAEQIALVEAPKSDVLNESQTEEISESDAFILDLLEETIEPEAELPTLNDTKHTETTSFEELSFDTISIEDKKTEEPQKEEIPLFVIDGQNRVSQIGKKQQVRSQKPKEFNINEEFSGKKGTKQKPSPENFTAADHSVTNYQYETESARIKRLEQNKLDNKIELGKLDNVLSELFKPLFSDTEPKVIYSNMLITDYMSIGFKVKELAEFALLGDFSTSESVISYLTDHLLIQNPCLGTKDIYGNIKNERVLLLIPKIANVILFNSFSIEAIKPEDIKKSNNAAAYYNFDLMPNVEQEQDEVVDYSIIPEAEHLEILEKKHKKKISSIIHTTIKQEKRLELASEILNEIADNMQNGGGRFVHEIIDFQDRYEAKEPWNTIVERVLALPEYHDCVSNSLLRSHVARFIPKGRRQLKIMQIKRLVLFKKDINVEI